MSPDMMVPHNESNGFFMLFSLITLGLYVLVPPWKRYVCRKCIFTQALFYDDHCLAFFNTCTQATSRFFKFFSSAGVKTRKLGK